MGFGPRPASMFLGRRRRCGPAHGLEANASLKDQSCRFQPRAESSRSASVRPGRGELSPVAGTTAAAPFHHQSCAPDGEALPEVGPRLAIGDDRPRARPRHPLGAEGVGREPHEEKSGVSPFLPFVATFV